MDSYLTKLYEKQISLTEWFEAIGDPRAKELREEDARKHDRLDTLQKIIGLPFGKPSRFKGTEVAKRTVTLRMFVEQHGDELCAIRLIPLKPTVPKLRMRGYSIKKALEWFDEQKVNPKDYDVDFVPHDDAKWATIFTVTNKGIFGEAKKGQPNSLTQGFYEDVPPTTFAYDFKTWKFDGLQPGIKDHLIEVVEKIKVTNPEQQKKLKKELGAEFAHDYLKGYFETSKSEEYGIWFIDYNRLLADIYEVQPPVKTTKAALVKGRAGSVGQASGVVRIVAADAIAKVRLNANDVLVCHMTTPDYLPLMQQAAAIVTDLGGVLSHAAIIARELKKPCVTGTKNATSILKEGQKVTVDANKGIVLAA
ncbi:MAG TPA: PEP-utilizing enzyme [Candidatus Saccharimonadales bacterium]|nr:PEP-utilizing enzyme [Candidatus Saccharimonadales bacterium]